MDSDIINALKKGKLIIYPTETSYALGCNILNEDSLNKVYSLKKRDSKKYLTCIVSDLNMASKYCELNEEEIKVCKKYMPGPLTLIAKKKSNVPDLLNKEFVFRIPGFRFARELCEEVGLPIVSTSANIAGEKEPYSIEDIPDEIKNVVYKIINMGKLEGKKPSTIITLRPTLKIIRKGSTKLI